MEIAPSAAGVPASPAAPWDAPPAPRTGVAHRLAAAYSASERGLLAIVTIAFVLVVYYPIVRNYFYMDDFLNIYHIVNKNFADYILRPHGGHLLVSRNTLFYLFHALFGTHAESYYWAVLLTHLVNVYLLFEVIRLLTASPRLACFGAVLWGTSPMNEGSLGWYSVYGHVVVGTALLVILYQVARSTAAQRPLPRYTAWLWLVLLLVATTSFGVGIGVTLVFPFVLWLFLPPSRQRTVRCLVFLAVALMIPPFYRWLVELHVAVTGIENEAAGVSLLIAGLRYWDLIVAMLVYLLSFSVTTLFLGFFLLHAKFQDWMPYVISVPYLAAVLIIGAASPSVTRRQLLALLLIAIGCYAMIAAGRATFFNLSTMVRAVVQPRYHYVGQMPLTIIVALMLSRLAVWVRLRMLWKELLLAAWLGLVAFAFDRADFRIDHHISARRETTAVVETLQAMIDGTSENNVYIRNDLFRSVGPMLVGYLPGFPGWAAIFTIYYPDNVVDGKRVYFVTDDPMVVTETSNGKRTRGLFVGPDFRAQPNG